MRKILRIIMYLVIIAVNFGLAYLIYTYKFLLYPLLVLTLMWISKAVYITLLCRKRNKIDFTTPKGKSSINLLNKKIDRLNGYFNTSTN